MLIEFYSGCFSRVINIKSNEKELFLTSDTEDDYDGVENKCENTWIQNLDKIKDTIIFMLNKMSINDIKNTYMNHITHDYENEITKSDKEMRSELTMYINNIKFKKTKNEFDESSLKDKFIDDDSYKDSHDLLILFIDFIEHFENITPDDYDSCDQCGNGNYTHTINLNFEIF